MTTGFHQLLIRFKNEQGAWSETQSRSFYIESTTQTGAITDIVAAEYYFDSDPGVGKATSLVGLTGSEIQNTFLMPTQSLSEGKHQIFLRVKNAQGNWSMAEHDEFTLCGEVLPTPVISGTANVCEGNLLELSSNQIDGATSYYWQGPNNFTSTERQISFASQKTSAGVYHIWAVKGDGVCDSSNVQRVEVVIYDQPELELTTTEVELCDFETFDLTGIHSDVHSTEGAVSYYSDPELTKQVEFPDVVAVTGTYYIQKLTENGCSDVKSVALNFVHCQVDQEITFEPLQDLVFGDSPISLLATASSGLPVSYSSSNTSVASIDGNVLTIVGAGSTTITASQSGDLDYFEALSVEQELVVQKAEQTISFEELFTYVFADERFDLEATASSGLPV
ncbi:MAG: hypothetical protein RJQ14_12345, partial [Marinoscillum sp.]